MDGEASAVEASLITERVCDEGLPVLLQERAIRSRSGTCSHSARSGGPSIAMIWSLRSSEPAEDILEASAEETEETSASSLV